MLQPPRLIAGVLGLAAFVAACVAGLASNADPSDTLWRALAALLICSILGAILGRVGMVAVDEHVAKHVADNPVPEDTAKPRPAGARAPGNADVEILEPEQPAPSAQAA
ncbi:MAG: hypothetical protein RIB60_05495 [Phycisphaerales bacterium]